MNELNKTIIYEVVKYPWWKFKKDEKFIKILLEDGNSLNSNNIFEYQIFIDKEKSFYNTNYYSDLPNLRFRKTCFHKEVYMDSFNFKNVGKENYIEITCKITIDYDDFGEKKRYKSYYKTTNTIIPQMLEVIHIYKNE